MIRVYAGAMNRLVTVEKVTDAGWTESCKVWASVYVTAASPETDVTEAGQRITHKLQTRYTPGIKPGMRIRLDEDRYLQIITVINMGESNRKLEILCEE